MKIGQRVSAAAGGANLKNSIVGVFKEVAAAMLAAGLLSIYFYKNRNCHMDLA